MSPRPRDSTDNQQKELSRVLLQGVVPNLVRLGQSVTTLWDQYFRSILSISEPPAQKNLAFRRVALAVSSHPSAALLAPIPPHEESNPDTSRGDRRLPLDRQSALSPTPHRQKRGKMPLLSVWGAHYCSDFPTLACVALGAASKLRTPRQKRTTLKTLNPSGRPGRLFTLPTPPSRVREGLPAHATALSLYLSNRRTARAAHRDLRPHRPGKCLSNEGRLCLFCCSEVAACSSCCTEREAAPAARETHAGGALISSFPLGLNVPDHSAYAFFKSYLQRLQSQLILVMFLLHAVRRGAGLPRSPSIAAAVAGLSTHNIDRGNCPALPVVLPLREPSSRPVCPPFLEHLFPRDVPCPSPCAESTVSTLR